MKFISQPLPALVLTAFVLFGLVGDVQAQQRRRNNARRPQPAPIEQSAEADAAAPAPETEPVTEPSVSTPEPIVAAVAPGPTEVPPVEVTTPAPDLAPLQAEYAAIMDELVKARARVAIVGKALFKTKVRIILQNRAGDAQNLERIVLRLDGAPIFRKDGGVGLDEGQQVFEGFATPGPHALDMEADQRSRANDAFGYTLRETFRFAVQKDRLTEITIVLDDDSDMAEDFPEDGEGEYDVRTRVTAATFELEAR